FCFPINIDKYNNNTFPLVLFLKSLFVSVFIHYAPCTVRLPTEESRELPE
ncbi:hypothetical protein BHE74_00024655, partial [Ensete ventricosum]